MPKLEPPDTHHLSAALGWLELGNAAESEVELQRVSEKFTKHPDVLEMKFAVAASRADWPAALVAAQQLVKAAPRRASGWLHRAYALRRVPEGGLAAAWTALLPASKKFPRVATIPYNLACYACRMVRLEEAWEWFERALRVGGAHEHTQLVAMALADPDLEPLHQRIKETHDDVPF